MTAEDIRAIRSYFEQHRTAAASFDIVAGGPQRPADWDQERARIRSAAQAGATWWVEWVPPVELKSMRAAIAHGPLRIE